MDDIKKKLQEDYEDALFAVLMDEFAQAEGERLYVENKALMENPSFQLPSGMEARGLKIIRETFRKKCRKSTIKSTGKLLSRAAVIVLILNVVFGISFFTVEAFRVKVLNMALNYQETHTTVRFIDDSFSENVRLTADALQKVLPESYTLEAHEETSDSEYALFINQNGSYIMWYVDPLSTTTNLDTENADYVEQISVDGCEGVLIEKTGVSTVFWGDSSVQKTYYIEADMPGEALLQLVKKLVS